jgi:hypothetical protein
VNTTNGFNYLIGLTAAAYKVTPFQLSISSTPPTLYLGRYDYPSISLSMGGRINFPFAVLSTAKSDSMLSQTMRVTPSTFSGDVPISVDFYITYPYGSLPPSGEAMYHAVEDAFIGTFNTPGAYGAFPSGVVYNNLVIVEQGNMGYEENRWVQLIPCALMFERVA